MSTMVADLVQDDRIVITSRLTLLIERAGIEWSVPAPVDPLPPSQCERFDVTGHVSYFGRVDSL